MRGAWAGWSSPTQFLAAEETLHWGGDELRGKTRLFQNCCGGSGAHALFVAWKNAAWVEDGKLHVNLHIDKSLPEAEIRGYQPWDGLLTLVLKRPMEVRVRIPDFVPPDQFKVQAENKKIAIRIEGGFAELLGCAPGETIRIRYPLPVKVEKLEIGNPGFRRYPYEVVWKGDTVLRMTFTGEEVQTGYSDFEQKDVRVYYGKAGPEPLYQREHFSRKQTPNLARLQVDASAINFW